MKKIPAPIDEKNVCTNWIEEIFDNLMCVQTDKQAVGFVDDDPVCAAWTSNAIVWKVAASNDQDATLHEIQKRLNEAFAESDVISECEKVGDCILQNLYFKEG